MGPKASFKRWRKKKKNNWRKIPLLLSYLDECGQANERVLLLNLMTENFMIFRAGDSATLSSLLHPDRGKVSEGMRWFGRHQRTIEEQERKLVNEGWPKGFFGTRQCCPTGWWEQHVSPRDDWHGSMKGDSFQGRNGRVELELEGSLPVNIHVTGRNKEYQYWLYYLV